MEGLNRRRRQSGDPCNCLRPVIRIWGIITAIVSCGVGVDIYMHGYTSGVFILLGSALVFLFEIKWVITLFLQLLFASDNYQSGCIHCWSISKIFGGWRLSPIYVAFGTALIIWPHNLWLSYMAGIQLIILAILRLCTLFRFSSLKGEGLLDRRDEFIEKSDGFVDDIDESFPEVRHSLEDEEPIDDDS